MDERPIALISGAGRGIGRSIALKLARDGYDIAIIYAGNESAAEQTRIDAEKAGATAKKYQCDVADFDQCAQVVGTVSAELGKISVLINNAGITRDMMALRMKEEDFSRVIDVDLKGAFNMIRQCYPMLMRAKNGRIVNISSVAGIMGNAGQANYCAAKAGMIGLTKSIAKELAPRGVTCNAIAPGFIETDMTSVIPEDKKQLLLGSIPMRRGGQAEEVAEAVAFLASPEASYITGAVLPVDGGMAM